MILFWFALQSLAIVFCAGSSQAAPVALVYEGPGVCAEKCSQAAAAIAIRAGLEVKFVSPANIRPSVLKQGAVWIQPGGDAIVVAKLLTPLQKHWLREFVRRGGGYLGFCAGAFLLDKTVDDEAVIPGLAMIPVPTRDYTLNQKRAVLPISWHGKVRHVYFEEGGYFDLSAQPSQHNPVHVLSQYENKTAAAIAVKFGLGHIVASFPHPEAFPDWLNNGKLNDPDGPDLDIADEMLKMVLPEFFRRTTNRD